MTTPGSKKSPWISAIFNGSPGTGKTAFVKEMAERLAKNTQSTGVVIGEAAVTEHIAHVLNKRSAIAAAAKGFPADRDIEQPEVIVGQRQRINI